MILLLSKNATVDEEQLKNHIKSHFGKSIQVRRFYKNLTDFEHGQTLFVVANDEELKVWLANVRHKDLTIYIIPNNANPLATKFFNLSKSLDELFANSQVTGFLTFVNDEVLFDRAIFGKNVEIPLFQPVKLYKTILLYGDQRLTTAALNMEIANERIFKQRGYALFDEESCDRTGVVIFSPKSIAEIVKLRLFQKKASLPQGMGVIKSSNVSIECEEAVSMMIDGKESLLKRFIVKTYKTPLRIVSGLECQPSQKDLVRTDNLIKDEELIDFFTKKSLPFLPIATEEAFAELFKKIRQNAKISALYLTLLIISVLMATLGLFQNSAPTIIGAMILAPLMAPLISLSMGVIRFEKLLFTQSFKTLALSVILALLLSAGMTFIFPYHHLTNQMALRTHPTLLDLGVAVLSGIAAAYGYANSKVGESLAGVAIAVALVPPLCVAGVGLGWGELSIFWHAFLLFLANIIGIAFAAGVMFYLLGYASKRYVTAAFLVKLLMISVVALPLYLSTSNFFLYEKIYDEITRLKLAEASIKINSIFKKDGTIFVDVEIVAATKEAQQEALDRLKNRFPDFRFIVTFKTLY